MSLFQEVKNEGLVEGIASAAGGLAAVAAVTGAGVYGYSEARYRTKFEVASPSVAEVTDAASLTRGAHLASALAGCTDCHGAQLAGEKIIDDPAIGRVYGPNLTKGKGGVGQLLTAL